MLIINAMWNIVGAVQCIISFFKANEKFNYCARQFCCDIICEINLNYIRIALVICHNEFFSIKFYKNRMKENITNCHHLEIIFHFTKWFSITRISIFNFCVKYKFWNVKARNCKRLKNRRKLIEKSWHHACVIINFYLIKWIDS